MGKMMIRKILAASFVSLATASAAFSATFYVNDAAGFGGVAGTLKEVPLPDVGKVGTGPVTVGPLTFDSQSGDLFFGGGFGSTLIPGNDTAISGTEDLQIDINVNSTAFRFFLVEPTTNTGQIDACNFTCVQSTFMIEAFRGGASVGSESFDPIDDFANFVGIFDAAGIDRVLITETTGNADNEFFGSFAIATIPVPASLPLILGGFAVLGMVGRRRRKS